VRYADGVNIETVVRNGLCMQCGTCAGICCRGALRMEWRLDTGWLPQVDPAVCNDCGQCQRACPGDGFDFGSGAWWRECNDGAAFQDFLGPHRGLWFGWAADPDVRFAGASGGAATAILQGALVAGEIDAAIVVAMSHKNPLAAVPVIARTPDEIAAARGSKYNAVAVNTMLETVLREPGRYAVVGLPCHVQGLRLAQRDNPKLRERVVLSLGIFCGWTSLPRATHAIARRAGMDPAMLARVRYRGPDWPGGMCLEARAGAPRDLPYPDYFDGYMLAWTPTRCRLCPDALAECADISVGDTWLDRFAGEPGVSDVIARTPMGERLIETLGGGRLTLTATSPREMVASQRELYRCKRDVYRGRLWLRRLAGRTIPEYPGVQFAASVADKVAGARNLLSELWFRALSDLRYR
jgi:coenzyme F420 hydrogenase subunit beta